MTLNDRGGQAVRDRLASELVWLRMIGTASDGRGEERRRMCAEWLATESALPVLLDAAGLTAAARRVREMPSGLATENIERLLWEVRAETWKARRAGLVRVRQTVRGGDGLLLHPLAAAAAVAAVAVAAAAEPYWKVYNAVKKAVKPIIETQVNELLGSTQDERMDSVFALLNRILPAEPAPDVIRRAQDLGMIAIAA